MSDSTYTAISCDRHDYLEIACMKGVLVTLEWVHGGSTEVTPFTTETRADKSEWLHVRTATGEVEAIRLDQIHAITPKISPRPFGRVEFMPLVQS